MNHDIFKQLQIKFDEACKRLREAEQNEKDCLARQYFNTASYWTNEVRKAWDESEHIRITMWKMTGEL